MRKRIAERRDTLRNQSGAYGGDDGFDDVLSMLVQANETEGKLRLDDEEMVSTAIACY
jgi:cytochrome P450